jgi:hypothetical protein
MPQSCIVRFDRFIVVVKKKKFVDDVSILYLYEYNVHDLRINCRNRKKKEIYI